jgi:hypothetical protein
VDPASGIDPLVAVRSLQDSIDALVRRGYTALDSRASACPQPPLYIRTNSVHPKNSGHGADAPVMRVSTPSPYLLWVAVTTPSRIDGIFGGTIRRGSEEFTCAGDNCAEVTVSIYVDPAGYSDAVARETLILDGLGLLGR